MEHVDFDTVDAQCGQDTCSFNPLSATFARKAQNHMSNDFETSFVSSKTRINKIRKCVSAIDRLQGSQMSRLEAILNPERQSPGPLLEDIQNGLGNTVRARADGDCSDIARRNHSSENAIELLRRAIGIRKSLQICDESARPAACIDLSFDCQSDASART